MIKYHKIQTVFKRDPKTNFKTLLEGDYSLPEFKYLANNQWVFTEKVDGTNIRVIFAGDANGIEFRGKTDNAQLPSPLFKRLEERFLSKETIFRNKFPNGVCLYGEGYGPNINKGDCYRNDQDFVLFDVKIGDYWLQRKVVEAIATELELDVVPIIDYGPLHEAIEMTRKGFNSMWGPFIAEGIVARPSVELRTRNGDRIITKIKHKDFK